MHSSYTKSKLVMHSSFTRSGPVMHSSFTKSKLVMHSSFSRSGPVTSSNSRSVRLGCNRPDKLRSPLDLLQRWVCGWCAIFVMGELMSLSVACRACAAGGCVEGASCPRYGHGDTVGLHVRYCGHPSGSTTLF